VHSSKVRTSPDALRVPHPKDPLRDPTVWLWARPKAPPRFEWSILVARAPPFAMLGRRPAIVAVVGATLFLGAFLATEQVSRPACPAPAQPAPRNLPNTLTGSRRARGRATRNPRLGDSVPSSRATTRRTRSSVTWTCRSAGPVPAPHCPRRLPRRRRRARARDPTLRPLLLAVQSAEGALGADGEPVCVRGGARLAALPCRPFEPPGSLPAPFSLL